MLACSGVLAGVLQVWRIIACSVVAKYCSRAPESTLSNATSKNLRIPSRAGFMAS